MRDHPLEIALGHLRQLGEIIGQLFGRFWENLESTFGQHGDYLVNIGGAFLGPVGSMWPFLKRISMSLDLQCRRSLEPQNSGDLFTRTQVRPLERLGREDSFCSGSIFLSFLFLSLPAILSRALEIFSIKQKSIRMALIRRVLIQST